MATTVVMFSVVLPALYFAVRWLVNLQDKESISVLALWRPTIAVSVAVFTIAFFMARHFVGESLCTVVAATKTYDAVRYIRFVGEGHFIRVAEKVSFIPKGEVKEITCAPKLPK